MPFLSASDLRVGLEEAYRGKRHHHLFAFFGTGVEEALEVADTRVQVVPVRSEIELREKMPALAADDEVRMAFLVPWTHDIPLDLAGRFALNGRVCKIGKESRLRALFGVSEVDEEARNSALGAYLLTAKAATRYPVFGSRLTIDAMWATWLKGDWGVDGEGGLGLDMLLAFVATDGRGPAFVEAMSRPEAGKTREALLEWLERTRGTTARVLWRAWENGLGRRAMELALVCEPLAKSPLAAVRMWVKTKVRELLGIEKDADVMAVAEALAREVGSAYRVLERKVLPGDLRSLGRAADALVVDAEVQACLVESTRLPSAWTLRLEALGLALKSGSEGLSVEAANEAVRALRALDTHAFFKDNENEGVLLRAEMATRLLAWLVARPDRMRVAGHGQPFGPSAGGHTPHGDAEMLGRWYVEEGGYVDRARHWARGTDEGAFGRGVRAVVAAADAARDELDRRFAKSLAAWVESAQPATQVVPIQDAVKRIAVRFLEGDESRRLMVLLMDGMAWAQATEILESLGSRAAPWGPLAWHAMRETKIGESAMPVVFAALPTVTDVSRSAFFGGKVLGPGAKRTTSDTEHWAQHAGVKKLVPATDVPRLLLRGEGHTTAGGASQEALSLVADPKRRIVALVLNAIDDSLKGSNAQRTPWKADSIASLPDLLDKAREHGRAVLLASDHGHVRADRMRPRVVPTSEAMGARWRKWPESGTGAALADNEMGFSGPRVYTPPGARGVVLLTDDASRYVANANAGEHGGATLAEVVAPCVLIGCEDAAGAVRDDPAQKPQAAFVPRWWHFDLSEPVVVETATVPEPKKEQKPKAQLALPTIVPPEVVAVVAVSVAGSGARPLSAFAGSAVLKVRAPDAGARGNVVEAVDALLERECVMSAEAFCAAIRELPYRVGGRISKLQEVLNLDGYEVIRFDPGTRQVYLDRAKLAQLFEVTL